jgi:hypothetical protein
MHARSLTTCRHRDLVPATCGGQRYSRLWRRGMGTGGAHVRDKASRWWSCRIPVPLPATTRARILFHPHTRCFSFCLGWVPGWLDRSSSLLAPVTAWAWGCLAPRRLVAEKLKTALRDRVAYCISTHESGRQVVEVPAARGHLPELACPRRSGLGSPASGAARGGGAGSR